MRRFFVEDMDEAGASARITGEEFRHLKNVLRLAEGDGIIVFNGTGAEFTGRIESIDAKGGVARIRLVEKKEGKAESPLKLTLLQALTKGDGPELIMQKAVELGATEIFFYTASRTVPKFDAARAAKRAGRLRRVAIGAAKQCGRSALPVVELTDFDGALRRAGDGLKIAFYEVEGARTVRDALAGKGREDCKSGVTVLIGPEGGLTHGEVSRARDAGFITCALGSRILRSDTAAIAALTLFQYELGDMG